MQAEEEIENFLSDRKKLLWTCAVFSLQIDQEMSNQTMKAREMGTPSQCFSTVGSLAKQALGSEYDPQSITTMSALCDTMNVTWDEIDHVRSQILLADQFIKIQDAFAKTGDSSMLTKQLESRRDLCLALACACMSIATERGKAIDKGVHFSRWFRENCVPSQDDLYCDRAYFSAASMLVQDANPSWVSLSEFSEENSDLVAMVKGSVLSLYK